MTGRATEPVSIVPRGKGRVPRAARRLEKPFVRRAVERRGGAPPALERDVSPLAEKIEHVVVLMMENHSYDNYFGMLELGQGFTRDGQGVPINSNPGRNGAVRVWRNPATTQVRHRPSQSWGASHEQWDEGACDGFVRSVDSTDPDVAKIGMCYWDEEHLPFYYGLARTFTLADAWYSSCLGPTFPNRRFLIAGTANGLIDDVPFGMFDYPERGTIFDLLAAHDITWANYHHLPKFRLALSRALGKPGLRAFRRIGLAVSHVIPQLFRYVVGRLQFTADLYPLGVLGCLAHLRPIERFRHDALNGTLPQVSIVDPRFSHCSEENPQDVRIGESFAYDVIDAVVHGKAWDKTLLIWTYDEHGGYYDHVAPDKVDPPDGVKPRSLIYARGPLGWLVRHSRWWAELEAADRGPRDYGRYGFRVPTVIVSPYAKPGKVVSCTYDHTSILRLIEDLWGLPPLTDRDAAARNPLDALDFTADPRLDISLTPPASPGAWRNFDQ